MLNEVDPTVLVALVTASGVVVSAGIGGVVTLFVSRSEKAKANSRASASDAAEARQAQMDTLRERLTLRDEQNQHLKLKNEQLEAVNNRLVQHVLELQERLDRPASLNVGGTDMDTAQDEIYDADSYAGEDVEPDHTLDLSLFEPEDDEEDEGDDIEEDR